MPETSRSYLDGFEHAVPTNIVADKAPPGLADQVIEAIQTVYDPEIPVNIWELGLIYDLEISADGSVAVRMTLTAPGCPVAGEMPGMVSAAVEPVEGVKDVSVEITWDPPWTQDRMSDAAKLQLNMF